MGASYYGCGSSAVLHTDICSPVATDPTWSRLSNTDRLMLGADGGLLWHELLSVLQPDVVLLSVAVRHLDAIRFDTLGRWEPIHTFDRTAGGAARKQPYRVSGCWHVVGGEASLFVFCPAAQTPVGSISINQRSELGSVVSTTHRAGR